MDFDYFYNMLTSKAFLSSLFFSILIISFKGYGYYSNMVIRIELEKANKLIKDQEASMNRMDEVMGHIDYCKTIDVKCNSFIAKLGSIDNRVKDLASDSKRLREYLEELDLRVESIEGSIVSMGDKMEILADSIIEISESIKSSPVELKVRLDRHTFYDGSAAVIPTDTHGDITLACYFGETVDYSSLLMHTWHVLPFVLIITVFISFIYKYSKSNHFVT